MSAPDGDRLVQDLEPPPPLSASRIWELGFERNMVEMGGYSALVTISEKNGVLFVKCSTDSMESNLYHMFHI
jgi:hypothetical protein